MQNSRIWENTPFVPIRYSQSPFPNAIHIRNLFSYKSTHWIFTFCNSNFYCWIRSKNGICWKETLCKREFYYAEMNIREWEIGEFLLLVLMLWYRKLNFCVNIWSHIYWFHIVCYHFIRSALRNLICNHISYENRFAHPIFHRYWSNLFRNHLILINFSPNNQSNFSLWIYRLQLTCISPKRSTRNTVENRNHSGKIHRLAKRPPRNLNKTKCPI